ncbi:MAG: hypothetical protein GVY29_08810, partial [Spirochaetes bacterium]|nr:hypothetical protein [Spirochaetota bacterium]
MTKRAGGTLRRMAGLLGILLSVWAVLSCDGTQSAAWRYSGFDANHSNVYPVAWDESWTVRDERRIPHPADGRGIVLLGDVRGTSAPELLFADDRSLTLLSLDGTRIDELDLPVVPAAPGFLFHADQDGKLDLAVGSANQAEPTFFATNGFGRSVHRYSIDGTARDYRSLIPALIADGEIYLMTREHWVDSPRGFIRYSPQSADEAWEYRVPGNPLDLVMDSGGQEPTFLVSYTTRPTGHARMLGTSHERKPAGIDALLRVIRFDAAGHTRSATLVTVDGEPLAGNAHLYPVPGPVPGSGSAVLMRHDQINYADAGGPADFIDFHLFRGVPRDEAIEPASSHRFGSSEFIDFRFLRAHGETHLLVLLRRAGRTVLELRTLDFELQSSVGVPSE